MIPNKDLSIDSENGKIVLNGDKYDLGTQGEIDTAVKDVYSVMGQLGAKNLISYPYYTPDVYTTNGITFTVNEDRSVTATGTATATAQYSLHSRAIGSNNELRVKNGDYIISDGGLQNVNIEIQVGVTKNGVYQQLAFTRNGEAEFTINGDDYAEDSANVQITLVVRKGATTPVTFKPMLRLASDTDNTYEPYAMTNKQLTEQVADVKGTIGDLTQTGVTGATVADQISNINTHLDDLIITQEFSGDIASLAGNTDTTISIPVVVPSGYKILGVAAAVSGSRNVAITGTLISTNAVSTHVYNLLSTALTNIKVYVVVEFIKI